MGCLSREEFLETLQCGGAPGAAHPPCRLRLPARFVLPRPALPAGGRPRNLAFAERGGPSRRAARGGGPPRTPLRSAPQPRPGRGPGRALKDAPAAPAPVARFLKMATNLLKEKYEENPSKAKTAAGY